MTGSCGYNAIPLGIILAILVATTLSVATPAPPLVNPQPYFAPAPRNNIHALAAPDPQVASSALSTPPSEQAELNELAELRSALTHDYSDYQRVRTRHTQLRAFLQSLEEKRKAKLAAAQLESLGLETASPHYLTEEQTARLARINYVRANGHRFDARIDPGRNVPFGSAWDAVRHGPYPANRLMEMEEKHWDANGVEKLKQELDNAWSALDGQHYAEASGAARGRMVYTDNTELLRSAIGYYEGKLRGLEEKVRV